VENVITKDNFHTLVDVVIVDLTHIDLVQCASTTTTHATAIAIQNIEQALGDDFILLAIKTYDCFRPHFDSF
jgi:hypothetical protein